MSTELAESAAPLTATAIQPGQWRLDRVELVNWGTFQGHHVIDVARRGFLLTGHSGSGKSSLVDAITAVLTPGGKIHFNAAAADASSKRADRNIASYVRGAWRRQSDDTTGEVVSEYLRTGATWSAVGLRYSNGTADPPVTLIKLAHLRAGANTAADASVLHLLSTEPIDVMDLQPYARDGLEMRKIKSAWPQATVTERHSVFAEKFCRLLGIGGENALVLLHKTQSAKNLGSLDDLFRGFMLDEPTTFAIADTAVEQFSDLSEAHTHVVTARRQIQHLSALRPHIGAVVGRSGLLGQRACGSDLVVGGPDPLLGACVLGPGELELPRLGESGQRRVQCLDVQRRRGVLVVGGAPSWPSLTQRLSPRRTSGTSSSATTGCNAPCAMTSSTA